MSAVIRGPRPQLSSGQRYNLSCSATGWSPFVLVNWTLARPGAATPTLVSQQWYYLLRKVGAMGGTDSTKLCLDLVNGRNIPWH